MNRDMSKNMNKKQECIYSIKQLHDSLEKHLNSNLKKSDLTMTQMGALCMLNYEKQGMCTLKEFEQILHLAQSTTVGIVKRLEQKGLVSCSVDSKDRRNKYVQITPKGEALCGPAVASMNTVTEDLFVGMTEEEMSTLIHLAKKLCENMK